MYRLCFSHENDNVGDRMLTYVGLINECSNVVNIFAPSYFAQITSEYEQFNNKLYIK